MPEVPVRLIADSVSVEELATTPPIDERMIAALRSDQNGFSPLPKQQQAPVLTCYTVTQKVAEVFEQSKQEQELEIAKTRVAPMGQFLQHDGTDGEEGCVSQTEDYERDIQVRQLD